MPAIDPRPPTWVVRTLHAAPTLSVPWQPTNSIVFESPHVSQPGKTFYAHQWAGHDVIQRMFGRTPGGGVRA
jgi:hypothetical protein